MRGTSLALGEKVHFFAADKDTQTNTQTQSTFKPRQRQTSIALQTAARCRFSERAACLWEREGTEYSDG